MQQFYPYFSSPSNSSAASSPITPIDGNYDYFQSSSPPLINFQHYEYLLQQQKKKHLQQLLEEQWASASVPVPITLSSNEEKDEITRSLKVFAMLTAYNAQDSIEELNTDFSLDFESNGFECEEDDQKCELQAEPNVAAYASHCNIDTTYFNNSYQSNATTALKNKIDYKNNRVPLKRCNNTKPNDKYNHIGKLHCVFCENNCEPEPVVKSHSVRDSLGRVLCPKLRMYVCPICNESGDNAHTVKYCPQKPIVTMEDAVKAQSFWLARSNNNTHQMKV